MSKVFQYKYIFTFLLILAGLSAAGQDFRKNRTESRSFKVGAKPELKISNKYGRVQLIPWAKDSIKLEVSIEVRAKKEAKAEESFKDIVIDFTSFQSYVESKTSFTSQDSFWGGIKGKSGSVFSSDDKTQIDYKVYLPKNTHLTIENKYGDIFLDEHFGTANISLSNGDLKAGKLMGATSITLEFAYATIKEMKVGSLKMDHKSELQLDKVQELRIDSRSSRVRIGEVGKINIKSYRDKYEVAKANDFDLTSSYTYMILNSLMKDIIVEAKYGSIDINELGPEVKKMSFTIEELDLVIYKPAAKSITVEAIYSEEAGLFFPTELVNKNTTLEDEEEKLVKTIGMVGDNFNAPIKLNITMPTGNLKIK